MGARQSRKALERIYFVMVMEKTNVGKVSMGTKLRRAVWNVVCVFFFRPFPTQLFHGWRIFLLRLFGAEIGAGANVYSSVKIWAPWNLKMGERSCLGPHVICYNQAMVVLEKDVTVSQYAYLCTAGHDTTKLNTADEGLIVAPIILHEGAWVGTRAFINMGVEVGENAIVGATASVYKDVEPMTIVGGNPAKLIKKRLLD